MIFLWTLESPYIVPGQVPTGWRDPLVSSDILLRRNKFLKILLSRFYWLKVKFKIPIFFRLIFFQIPSFT